MTPTLEHSHDDRFELVADRGTMRMLLTGALNDANLWTRAVGASQETKNHWARRGNVIRALLDQMPAPANPRDPFEDLPGEPTPEEADAAWKARAAAEDARRDAAKAASERVVTGRAVDADLSDGLANALFYGPTDLGDDLDGLLG